LSSDAPPTLPRWIPLTLLTLTVVALFYRFILGEVLFWGLPSLQFYPWREFAMSEFAQGRFPLWNPYNGAGAPLLANYQSALLYPPHVLYWLFSGPLMPHLMGWLGILHLIWAGAGMWLLTGRLKLPTFARGIATLAYPLSSTLVARFGTLPMVDVAAWLPWLVWAIDALIDTPTLARVLILTGMLAMQLLAGHAQWAFYSLVLMGGYAVWRIVVERKPRKVLARIVVGGMVAGALAVGIAGAQLLPTAELQRESQRASGVDEDFALNFSFSPLSLITLFNPNFFGNPGDGSYVIGGAYFETAAYIGVLPMTLALIGTIHYFRMRRRGATESIPVERVYLIPFFALVTVVSVVFAFGKFTPIYVFLYRYVPTFNLFQAPARWLLLAVFSLTMLAALAVPMWRPWPQTRRRARLLLIGAVGLIAAGILVQVAAPGLNKIVLQMAGGLTILGVLLMATAMILITHPLNEQRWPRWAISVLLFVTVDLWWANSLSTPTVPASFYEKQAPVTQERIFWRDPKNAALPEVAFERFVPLKSYPIAVERWPTFRKSMLPNLNLLDRQPSLNNFDPLRPEGLERFTRMVNTASTSNHTLLQAAAVGAQFKEPIGYPREFNPQSEWIFEALAEGKAPRAWMVPTAVRVKNIDEAEQLMKVGGWNPYQTALIEADPEVNLPTVTRAGTAGITQETTQELTIAVDAPEGGILVVADTYFPGWEAEIDETSTRIYRANMAFRAVVVSPGTHTVRMIYKPRSFAIGSAISGGAVAISAMLLVLAVVRWRRSAR
jgi:hypothetical protein